MQLMPKISELRKKEDDAKSEQVKAMCAEQRRRLQDRVAELMR